MRLAVEAQLDAEISPHERTRRLENAHAKILYWQNRNVEAASRHDRTRRRRLEAAGVDLQTILLCPIVVLALEC